MVEHLDNTYRMYAVYELATGFINGVHNVPQHTVEHLTINQPELAFIEVDYALDTTDLYVLDGDILPKPTMPLVISGNRILGVPLGASVWVGDAHYICDDGEVIIDFDIPPLFPIVIDLLPYKTERVTLDY